LTRRRRIRCSLLAAGAIAGWGLALLPLAWVVGGGAVSVAGAGRVAVADAVAWRLWGRSVTIALVATLLAMGVGLPAGWALARARLPGRGGWWAAASLPLLLPPYGMVVAALFLHERFGSGTVVPAWAGVALGLPVAIATAAIVLAAGTWPVVAILVALAARSVPRELEDAARLERTDGGAAWFAAWPHLRASWLAGGMFVFLSAFANYSVGDSLGLPTFAREILMRFRADFSQATAARLGSLALLVAFPLVAIQRGWLLRVALAPVASEPLPALRGSGRLVAGIAALAGALAISAALPVTALAIHASEREGWQLALAAGWDPLIQSATLAGAAALLSLLLAMALGASVALRSSARRSWADLVATLPYALPASLLAIGMVWAIDRILVRALPAVWFDRSPLALAWVGALLGLPYAYWLMAPAWSRIDRDLDGDALLHGAGAWARWRHVVWPALAGPAGVAGAVVFALVAREMEATVILRPPGWYPLAFAVWDALHFGSREQAAATCLLMVGGTGLVIAAPLAIALRRR